MPKQFVGVFLILMLQIYADMQQIIKVSFIAAALLLSSCTAFFLPDTQQVVFHTDSDSSHVNANAKELGKGKKISSDIDRSGFQEIVIQTPGFKDEHHLLIPVKRDPLFYPIAILDLPLVALGWDNVLREPQSFLYANEVHLKHQVAYEKRNPAQRYINIQDVKIDIQNFDEDIQFYLVPHALDIEPTLLQQKELRISENLEAKRLEEERLAQLTKKKRGRKLFSASLEKVEERKTLFAENTIFTEDLFKVLYQSGFVDTVNTVFKDYNNTIFLQAKIKEIDEFVMFEGYENYRKLGIKVTWTSFNSYDEIIDSLDIYSFSDPFVTESYIIPDYVGMINDALAQSYYELKQTAPFQQKLPVQKDFNSQEPLLSLPKPRLLVKEVSDAALASVIIKRTDGGHGSGFAISQDGYILTNYHVIAGKNQDKPTTVKVILSNGIPLDAEVIRYNGARDIALLKVAYNFEKAFLLSNVKSFKNLSEVYTIGAPKSIELGQSVSLGLISNERTTNNNNLLQLNININGGNSGGPLFDKNGTLHGVIQSKLVGKDTEGVGFAIPSYLLFSYLNIQYQN
jgi:S1-C subfamily serine protease